MNHSRLNFLCHFVDVVTKRKDPYEKHEFNHGKNTAVLSERLALAAGISEDIAHIVKHAAQIHDWGKMVIPEDILNKPGLLSDAEAGMVRNHPFFGYEMFRSLNFGKDIDDIVLPVLKNHHEWWNGTGYPDGLKGEQISIYARIVSITDAYDVLTDNRPYKPIPILNKPALDRLMEAYGVQFDPELLKLFVKMMVKE